MLHELPSDIKLRILSEVRALREPKRVLSTNLKQDIESRAMLRDLFVRLERYYQGKAHYYLRWIQSDLLHHLNDYRNLKNYLSQDIVEHFPPSVRREDIVRILTEDYSFNKHSIYRLWHMMSFKKRQLFLSKYRWCKRA